MAKVNTSSEIDDIIGAAKRTKAMGETGKYGNVVDVEPTALQEKEIVDLGGKVAKTEEGRFHLSFEW